MVDAAAVIYNMRRKKNILRNRFNQRKEHFTCIFVSSAFSSMQPVHNFVYFLGITQHKLVFFHFFETCKKKKETAFPRKTSMKGKVWMEQLRTKCFVVHGKMIFPRQLCLKREKTFINHR